MKGMWSRHVTGARLLNVVSVSLDPATILHIGGTVRNDHVQALPRLLLLGDFSDLLVARRRRLSGAAASVRAAALQRRYPSDLY